MSQNFETALIFVFESLPKIDRDLFISAIESIEPLTSPVKIDILVETTDTMLAFIEFDDRKLRLIGFNSPVPNSTIEYTVKVSNWQKTDLQAIERHQAHIICSIESSLGDPIERFISIYKVASACYDLGILGILDETAWNCMPRKAIETQIKSQMLELCRKTIPLGLWTGFVKFFRQDNLIWFCSKGFHVFGVNDFAYLGTLEDAKFAFETFNNIFSYIRDDRAIIKSGHTAQISENQYIRFGELYEYREFLDSPLGTLTIEKINPSKINTSRN